MTTGLLPPYSYSPAGLVQEFRKLKAQEEGKSSIETTSSHISTFDAATPSSFVVAAVQLTAGGLEKNSVQGYWERAQQAVQEAATKKGAHLILLPELFIGPYFCQSQEASLMELAIDAEESFIITRMQALAKQYQVVLPISIYERQNNALYNSVVMIDADGSILGTYRT
jgi:predicted amidohydrolase